MSQPETTEPAAAAVRVLIADDQTLVRSGLVALLDGEDGIEVVADVEDGAAAVVACRELEPDVAILDIRMPVLDGIAAARRIVASSRTRVLMLTTFDVDEYVFAAIEAGASGFILKASAPEHLLSAVRVVAAGDALLDPAVTLRVIEQFGPAKGSTPGDARLDVLTPREREILVEVGKGLNNAEIAAQLYVSQATVKTHINRLLSKLGARDRVQLVIIAYETGLAD